jgi:hypothetical protein
MLQAKRFYLDQLKDGPKSHRTIQNNMASKFEVSTAKIRDELIKDGYIVVANYKKMGLSEKRNYSYKLTGKRLGDSKQLDERWPEGHIKSTGNAFDWRGRDSTLLSRQEIANSRNAGRPTNYNPFPITTFSRAKLVL